MLRRRLLVIFGSLVILLVAMAVAGIWMLQDVLEGLDHINTEAMAVVEGATGLSAALTAIEIDLYRLQLGHQRHLDALIDDMESVRLLAEQIGGSYVVRSADVWPHYEALLAGYPAFEGRVSSLATAQDAVLARQHNVAALEQAMALRTSVRQIESRARAHARGEQLAVARRFRWLVLAMAIGWMIVINVSILVLLRASAMVLRPVDKLVQAGRQLAQQRFDHRAHLDSRDEFHEIAEAYNQLAERVQTNEQQKLEMLAQVAATLNHELNNALAVAELQLRLAGRPTACDDKCATSLERIHRGLRRMAETVESLKHIRRIVLTDYIAGVKMLDLQRSIQEAPPEEGALSATESEPTENP